MTLPSRYDALRARLADRWQSRALHLKAISFAGIGAINTVVDFVSFLIARSLLSHSAAAMSAIDALIHSCHCGNSQAIVLVVANIMSWSVAVTGSYVLNSSITFAAESGRKLRWRAFGSFAASSVVGWVANTATLVSLVQILLLPVWLAKAIAVLVSFGVNFSMSNFIVFRNRAHSTRDGGEIG
jgi:putative flippase GtrA